MSALAVLETSLLLGLYALLAGAWGLCYALARLRGTPLFRRAAVALYGLHGVAAFAIVFSTPLVPGWKCLIVASSVVFLAIPPITWRFLQHTHANERSEDDREPSQHSARIVARL